MKLPEKRYMDEAQRDIALEDEASFKAPTNIVNTLTGGIVSVTPDATEGTLVKHPTIVSAAIQYYGMIISLPRPARHFHVSGLLFEFIIERLKPEEQKDLTGHYEEGFLTSDGAFIGRKAANELVKLNGQQLQPVPRHPIDLFTENLW